MILSIEDNEVLERDNEYYEHACAIEPLSILLVPRVADHALHELQVGKKNCNFEEGQDDLHVDLGSIDLQYRNQCKTSDDNQNRINKHHQQDASVQGEAFAEEVFQIDPTNARQSSEPG